MPLDAICLAAVRKELAESITGLRIDKVAQPQRDIVILTLRGGGVPSRLLISAGSGDARAHLTEYRFENPASPPMFCMLLRKHIGGARIVDIKQPRAERVLQLCLESPDAFGAVTEKSLILEFIGSFSNIILTGDDGIIIDCLRRVGGEFSSKDRRAVLPGLLYRLPPAQEGKHDPLSVSSEKWRELFGAWNGAAADKWLISVFTAMSPLICRELSWRAYGETDAGAAAIKDGGAALMREFLELMENVKAGAFEPWSVSPPGEAPRDFSYTMIRQYEGHYDSARNESFSAMLDGFYSRKAQAQSIRRQSAVTIKTVKNARDRIARKLAAQSEELKKTEERDKLRQCGDIITANIHLMKKGQSFLQAQDFYADEGKMRKIPLDPLKTPQQNAEKYYKEYTKAKNAEKFLTEQIRIGENELIYLESVLEDLALSEGERDLLEIRRELTQTGYLKAQKKGREKAIESAPMRFESSAGVQILAGKNNTQNEKLTLKTASKTDVWLHVQKEHGCHVVILCGGAQPDDLTLSEAAAIAAYYSSARCAGKAPVDYTQIKYVKKPAGSRPGRVIYTDYETIIARPDEELMMRLRRG